MQTLVFGLRHKSAPIEIREHLAFSASETPKALSALAQLPDVAQVVILSTCNRIEIYAQVAHPERALAQIQQYLSQLKQLPAESFLPYSFALEGEQAIEHLFEVASGLDSLVLGEDQILAQVKESLHLSMLAKASGLEIEQIFKTALTVGKAVRTEAGIAARDISIAKAAFEFAELNQKSLLGQTTAVIGGGKMAQILLGCFASSIPLSANKAKQVIVVNRHDERAEELAKIYGFWAQKWSELDAVLQQADTIFVATASPHFILRPEHFYHVPRPRFIVDISVPRNVDPTVGQFNGIHLYNTDDLVGFSGYSGENQQRLIAQARTIIDRELQGLRLWQQSRTVAPLIAQIRAHFDEIRQNQVAAVLNENPNLMSAEDIIEQVTRTALNKILHAPTVALKQKVQSRSVHDPVAEFEALLATHLLGQQVLEETSVEAPDLDMDSATASSLANFQLIETAREQRHLKVV